MSLHRLYRGFSRLCGLAQGPLPKPGLRALLYHAVGTPLPGEPCGTSISAGLFARHIEHLDSLRNVFKFRHFAAPGSDSPCLALTFDDGYRDVLAAAAPLLAVRGIPFTMFVVSDFILRGAAPYLDEAGLKELARLSGARIGSHGKTHRPLTALGDAELREELAGSRKFLEDLLGLPVTSISYPYGSVDRRVRDAAQEAGYVLGGTSRYGLNLPGRDPLLLCRTEIVAWDEIEDLELKVKGRWDWYRFRHPDPAAQNR
ncbi:MAG: polysaccharide deacetylase family protein [Elusimicrobia bacterium]|nr:polysaccharide deacetylase family protein [Elusimicrobiota bacterium]